MPRGATVGTASGAVPDWRVVVYPVTTPEHVGQLVTKRKERVHAIACSHIGVAAGKIVPRCPRHPEAPKVGSRLDIGLNRGASNCGGLVPWAYVGRSVKLSRASLAPCRYWRRCSLRARATRDRSGVRGGQGNRGDGRVEERRRQGRTGVGAALLVSGAETPHSDGDAIQRCVRRVSGSSHFARSPSRRPSTGT